MKSYNVTQEKFFPSSNNGGTGGKAHDVAANAVQRMHQSFYNNHSGKYSTKGECLMSLDFHDQGRGVKKPGMRTTAA